MDSMPNINDPLAGVLAKLTGQTRPSEKALTLLDLARSDTRLAETTFNALPLEEQTALVLSVSPDQRLDLLNLPEDSTALVQALPLLELHRTVAVAGKWEAMEVVEVASEEQINFMLDHDCWRGESLDSRKFTDWLQLFLECDDAQVFRILTAINADLLALALKKHVKFEKDFMVDDVYFLDPDWVKGSNPAVQQFLDRLYAMDPNLWIRLLGWVRLHSKGTIEADAIEGREGRLRGKGFPAPTLAVTVYYPIKFDVKALVDGWHDAFLAGSRDGRQVMLADCARESLFLERVLRLLRDREGIESHASRWETELVDVANKVMVADQVDIGDLRRQREAVDKVRRWISVGLEALAGGAVEAGVSLLAGQKIEYFFRAGAMLFDALSTAVVEIEKVEQKSGGKLSGSDLGVAYFALCEPEPQIQTSLQASAKHHIMTLSDYRYAWHLLWLLEHESITAAEAVSQGAQ